MPLDTSPPDTIQRHEMLQAGLDLLDQGLTGGESHYLSHTWSLSLHCRCRILTSP